MTGSIPRRDRLVTLLLRPSTPPLVWGIALAAVLIAVEVVIVLALKRIAPENAFGAVFLFGVLVVSAGWGFRLSIATSVASAAAYAYVHATESSDSVVPAVLVFSILALLTNVLVGQSRLRAVESDQRRREAAALRRVATLVAQRGEPTDVYSAVTVELAEGLHAEHVSLVRYGDGDYSVLAARDSDGSRLLPGERFELGGHNAGTLVLETGEATSIDFTSATGGIAGRLSGRGLRSSIGVPISIDGRTWGAVIVGSTNAAPDPDVWARLGDFADLVATAVYNAETRDALTRSRARVVAGADQARRTIERDLHDGAQQRIVSLGMELRAAQAAIPPELDDLRLRMDRSVDTLNQVHTDLRELSRGIHPAILSRGGLGPALKTLARRSPVLVSLTVDIPSRLAESVEVAAYYVAAEALTNCAKYAEASEVVISAMAADGHLDLAVTDDGRGGADPGNGSGLIGLQDRVAAVGGVLTISSPQGGGTTLSVRIDTTTG